MDTHKPKLGLALSGAAARSVFYIGFLEVLREQHIEIDYIAACSGATLVAACYACGSLDELKDQALSLDREGIFEILERGKKGGLYNLDKFEDIVRDLTRNKRFEDIKPQMGFIAADIERGEKVVMSMGDLARAVRISCTVPGLFEPVQWGSRTLVDGGLLTVVPGDIVRQAHMDTVIGIHIRATDFIFYKNQLQLKRLFNALKKILLLNQAERLWKRLKYLLEHGNFFDYYNNFDDVANSASYPGMFTILGRSMDIAIKAEKQHRDNGADNAYDCDLLIKIDSNKFQTVNLKNTKLLYKQGREAALKYLPHIKQVIAEHQPVAQTIR